MRTIQAVLASYTFRYGDAVAIRTSWYPYVTVIATCWIAIAVLVLVGCDDMVPSPPDTAPVFQGTVADRTYTVGVAITALMLPAATGGNGALTYSLQPDVGGLRFDAGSRTLRGTPSAAGSHRMTYRAVDDDDNTAASDAAALRFTITVQEAAPPDTAPVFQGTIANQTYTVGVAIGPLTLPEAVGGNGALNYELRPDVPGLTFDSETRMLSGTPSTADSYRMIYRVTDADNDTAVVKFTMTTINPEGIFHAYRGSGDDVFHLNRNGDALEDALYTLLLSGDSAAEVYLISTNTKDSEVTPGIERLDDTNAVVRAVADGMHGLLRATYAVHARSSGPGWRWSAADGIPHDFSADVPHVHSATSRRTVKAGDKFVFHNILSPYDGTNFDAIPATARRVVTDGRVAFAVWVADRDWGSCSQCVRQEMVDAVASRFLRPGSDNDIYDWVISIAGEPWGPHDYPSLIPSEYADEIHFLVATTESNYNPMHNYRRDPDHRIYRFSGERLMFTMHPGLLVQADGPTWEESDGGPSWFIGAALAHEYQHMIHFYQKSVKHRFEPVRYQWINEMTSMVVEEMIAEKIMLADGLRSDLLSLYNGHNDWQVSTWKGPATYYAVNYALGSYLVRTYGIRLFRDIVQNDQSGIHAIEDALRVHGHSMSFGDVLQNWAVANLLSDNTAAPHPYRYNTGTWFTSQTGGETFRYASINLFNYRYYYGDDPNDYWDGPLLYSISEFNKKGSQPPHSNRYVTLGRASGTVRLRITAVGGNRITVVIKE